MAALGSQSIASSYEQLLHVDADGGGNGTTHVSVKDGDNGTTFGFTIASDALMMTSTNRLEFGDNGTYIHQSADGVLDLVSDSEIELNGTIDINGAVTMDGGNVTINDDSGDYDFRVESNGNANMLFVDGGNDGVGITTNNPQNNLDLGNASGGTGIAWGGTTGTAHYTTIWSEYGTGSLIVGAGLKGSTSASTFLNPHTGTYGYSAIELDSFSDDGIKFYVGADSSKTKDASITPSEAMRIDSSGNVGIDQTSPSSFYSGARNLVIGNTSQAESGLTIVSSGGASSYGEIFFADGTTGNQAYRGFIQYNHDNSTDSLLFGTAGTERMRIDSSGNVGIGTTSPNDKLTVNENNTSFATYDLASFMTSTDTNDSRLTIRGVQGAVQDRRIELQSFRDNGGVVAPLILNPDGGKVGIGDNFSESTLLAFTDKLAVKTTESGTHNVINLGWAHSNTTTDIEQRIHWSFGDDASADNYQSAGYIGMGKDDTWQGNAQRSSYLSFATGSGASVSERMRIDSSGNVGIGTANPSRDLVIDRAGEESAIQLDGDSDQQQAIYFSKASSDQWALYAPASTSDLRLWDGSSDRVSFQDGGNVGINYTSNPSGMKFAVNGKSYTNDGLHFSSTSDNNAINVGSHGSGSTTLYIGNATITVSSDERIKKNIENTKINATKTLNKLRVVDFEWDDPSDEGSYNNKNARVSHGGQWTGLVAQEIVNHVPHIVNAPRKEDTLEIDYESDDTWFVDFEHLVPTLVKAVQELSAQNDALTARIEALENA